MGAGKSVIGRALAEKLQQPFLDLDEEIERSEGKSIFRIFADNGERYFRMKEREVLKNLEQETWCLQLEEELLPLMTT